MTDKLWNDATIRLPQEVYKKSDLHSKSIRLIVALGIFVCYTLKIEGSEESEQKKNL
jgi:hypothetical protein